MRKNNLKSVLFTVVLFLMTAFAAKAQVFIADDEFEGNMRLGDGEWVLVAPAQGLDSDEFLPLDGGWLLLTGMGTAYMLSKRKKEKQSE